VQERRENDFGTKIIQYFEFYSSLLIIPTGTMYNIFELPEKSVANTVAIEIENVALELVAAMHVLVANEVAEECPFWQFV
jgi:hypothetical protein